MAAIPDLMSYVQRAIDVGLPAPTARSGATSGDPRESAVVLHKDDTLEIGVWECSPGVFPGARPGYNEFMVVVKGAGSIATTGGETIEFEPGTVFFTLDGWTGQWDVRESIRKVYAIWNDTRA